MKKWNTWGLICLVSLANGWIFYQASRSAMEQGLEGADNMAALLFIPLLWMLAGSVLLILNLCTLLWERQIEAGRRVRLTELFSPSEPGRPGRRGFLLLTCVLMVLAFMLFLPAAVWSAAYALSGGALMVLLYAWGTSGSWPARAGRR